MTSACAAGVSSNMTTVSPPPTTTLPDSPIGGNAKTLKSVSGSRPWSTTPGTKSPSITCAPFAVAAKTFETEVGKSVWSAPEVPPTMLSALPTIFAISVSASLTDWSVHGISCVESWSYFSGPAVRR